MKNAEDNRLRLCIMIIITLVLSALLFLGSYYGDNKYTNKSTQPVAGVLILNERDVENGRFVYLINDWEIYRDKLLTPTDFEEFILPDEYVFIGQYGGFEGDSGSNRSPHGSATYRLNISVSSAPGFYTLEIPEIYSSYRIYINGILSSQMGEPSPEKYYAKTGMSKLSFYAENRVEIIIQATDYDHFYSGMVYPPAFGKADVVDKVLAARLTLRTVVIVLALGVGLIYFVIWLILSKNKSRAVNFALYYTALCMCYALYISYPIVKSFFSVSNYWYIIENLALPFLLSIIMETQLRITDVSGLYAKAMSTTSIFTCFWSLFVPFIMGDSLLLMMAHSRLMGGYIWICAVFLIISSARCILKGISHSSIILAGSVTFGASLLMDRMLPLFEPIYFGWFSEIAGGFYVAIISGIMTSAVASEFSMRIRLEGEVENVTRIMAVQKADYTDLLKKEEKLRADRHDFRHHIAVLKQLTASRDIKGLQTYLENFEQKHSTTLLSVSFCKNYVIDMVLRMYSKLAQSADCPFTVKAQLHAELPFDDSDLCVLLSNLLENALEASGYLPQSKRYIRIDIRCRMNLFGVSVTNAFDGFLQKQNNNYFSRKQEGRNGIGIASIRAICDKYGGTSDFRIQENDLFRSDIFLPLDQQKNNSSEE